MKYEVLVYTKTLLKIVVEIREKFQKLKKRSSFLLNNFHESIQELDVIFQFFTDVSSKLTYLLDYKQLHELDDVVFLKSYFTEIQEITVKIFTLLRSILWSYLKDFFFQKKIKIKKLDPLLQIFFKFNTVCSTQQKWYPFKISFEEIIEKIVVSRVSFISDYFVLFKDNFIDFLLLNYDTNLQKHIIDLSGIIEDINKDNFVIMNGNNYNFKKNIFVVKNDSVVELSNDFNSFIKNLIFKEILCVKEVVKVFKENKFCKNIPFFQSDFNGENRKNIIINTAICELDGNDNQWERYFIRLLYNKIENLVYAQLNIPISLCEVENVEKIKIEQKNFEFFAEFLNRFGQTNFYGFYNDKNLELKNECKCKTQFFRFIERCSFPRVERCKDLFVFQSIFEYIQNILLNQKQDIINSPNLNNMCVLFNDVNEIKNKFEVEEYSVELVGFIENMIKKEGKLFWKKKKRIFLFGGGWKTSIMIEYISAILDKFFSVVNSKKLNPSSLVLVFFNNFLIMYKEKIKKRNWKKCKKDIDVFNNWLKEIVYLNEDEKENIKNLDIFREINLIIQVKEMKRFNICSIFTRKRRILPIVEKKK